MRLVIFIFIAIINLSQTTSASEFEFSPAGCEYTVTFPSSPKQYSQEKASGGGAYLPLHGAQLTVASGAGFLRAECVQVEGYDKKALADGLSSYSQEIAKDMGLLRPSIEINQSQLGLTSTITGVKESERGRLTVRIINIHGDSSVLTLYLSAFSSKFETPEMQPFVNSVKLKRSPQ